MNDTTTSRIESKLEISAYIQNLKYALNHNASITFQETRFVDTKRNERFTNKYTIAHLFPNEDPVEALRRELKTLSIQEYIRTVKDSRFPKRSEMREFGKTYCGNQDVYIKIRVEVLNILGNTTTFVMSFHFAEYPFREELFPYRTE